MTEQRPIFTSAWVRACDVREFERARFIPDGAFLTVLDIDSSDRVVVIRREGDVPTSLLPYTPVEILLRVPFTEYIE